MRLTPLLLLFSAVLLGWSLPAHAHTSLVSSDPSEGARLDSAPQQVVLTFSENLNQPSEAGLVVDGTTRDASVEVDGRRLVVTATGERPDGAYQVNYRVVSADGHPVTGTLSFTVGEATAAADDTTEVPADTENTVPSMSTIVLIVGLVLVGVALAVLFLRRGRSNTVKPDDRS